MKTETNFDRLNALLDRCDPSTHRQIRSIVLGYVADDVPSDVFRKALELAQQSIPKRDQVQS